MLIIYVVYGEHFDNAVYTTKTDTYIKDKGDVSTKIISEIRKLAESVRSIKYIHKEEVVHTYTDVSGNSTNAITGKQILNRTDCLNITGN